MQKESGPADPKPETRNQSKDVIHAPEPNLNRRAPSTLL
ncbi:hypothetical protein R38712_05061 [Ralstonia pickettii]|jgi:hypothetical protein|uniref:Uncharacterized protein n=1 Tax=Ralstonia pickettii TaxID=329 RepID=A0ABM9IVF0_RALPI|nr:hypothetical protein R38712_05061 [Ralstonia pickettii]